MRIPTAGSVLFLYYYFLCLYYNYIKFSFSPLSFVKSQLGLFLIFNIRNQKIN